MSSGLLLWVALPSEATLRRGSPKENCECSYCLSASLVVFRASAGQLVGSAKDRHDAGVGVDANAIAGLDHLRCGPSTNHGGQAVFPGDDGRVAHDPANVDDNR